MKDFGFDICKGDTPGHKHLEEYFGTICYPNYCQNLVSTRLENGDLWAFSGYPIDSIERSNIVDLKSFKKIFTSIDGPFFSLYWENKSNRVILVTDILGIFPIYWKIEDSRIRICNKILPLASKPNLASWGAFYTYGCAIGNNTLAEGVERLPPASCITISPDNLKITQETYWVWPERNRNASVDEVYDALIADLERIKPQLSNPNILLSGGFDSRLLAYALNDINIKPNAVIVSHSDEKMDSDRKYAEKIAAQLNFQYSLHYPKNNFFISDNYWNYLEATEGETPSLNLFIAKVYQFVPSGGELFEGVIPGCTLSLLHQPPGGPENYLSSDKIVQRKDSIRYKSMCNIYTKSILSEMLEGFSYQIHEEKQKYENSDHGTMQFICMNRTRNRTSINPFKAYSKKTIPNGLGISRNFIESISQLTYCDRNNASFYRKLFDSKAPSATLIPVISGGISYPLNSGRVSQYIESLYGIFHDRISMHPKIRHFLSKKDSIDNVSLINERLYSITKHYHEYNNNNLSSFSNISLHNLDTRESMDTLKCLFHWNTWQSLLSNLNRK